MKDQYWKRKSLQEMTAKEWEGLCDGCARCCMHKVEDEETGEIFYTDLACRLLDLDTCRCTDYANRVKQVSECLVLTADKPDMFSWLPATCAYRRLANGQDLLDWHPLISGNAESVHEAGISVKGKAISENETKLFTVMQKLSD
jgi:hypothetical protein